MQVPDSLESLVTEGIITAVIRPLMSGKEAQIYLVEAGGELRVAKIYKDAINRSFKHRAEYTEGRGVRSSRDARAMQKRSKYGKAMDEEAWRSAEVDIIHRLRAAGVRVPTPHQFVDGVLVMELVKDADGDPAPRLGDVELTAEQARLCFDHLITEVVRMVCAGVVHGDLSDFNVLLGAEGPVIIDFPQAVDPSRNQNARELLIRDVDNLTNFLSKHEPGMKRRPYGQEIWAAYERSELTPDTVLTGTWKPTDKVVDTTAVLFELAAVEKEELQRRGVRPQQGGGGRSGGQRSGSGAKPAAGAAAAPPRRDDRGQRTDPRPPQQQARPDATRRDDRAPGPGAPPSRRDEQPRHRREDQPSLRRDPPQGPAPGPDTRPQQGRDERSPYRPDDRALRTDGPPPRQDARGPQRREDRGSPRPHDRGPQQRDDRGPQPRDDREPPRRDPRGAPRSDDRGPPRHDDRGPQRRDDRGPQQRDDRGPPRNDDRGPLQRDDRGPQQRDDRGPLQRDGQGRQRRDDRAPQQRDAQGPQRRDDRGPPPRVEERGPRRDDRAPPPRDDRAPPRPDDRSRPRANYLQPRADSQPRGDRADHRASSPPSPPQRADGARAADHRDGPPPGPGRRHRDWR